MAKATHKGICQVCGREQKVSADGSIVLHGYKRKGCGYIDGRCPGSHQLALELSAEYGRNFLVAVGNDIAQLEGAVEVLRSGDVAELPVEKQVRREDGRGWAWSVVTVTPADPTWRRELEAAKGRQESKLYAARSFARDLEARVGAHWAPSELRPV